MLGPGAAKKVSIHIGEDQSYHGRAAYLAIMEYLLYRGVAGATVVRGIAGFGADHRMHTTAIERLTENLPLQIQFIESESKVNEVIPELHRMVGTGLIEIESTVVDKPPQTGTVRNATELRDSGINSGTARLMRICINEQDTWKGRPLYAALLECLRANSIPGATAYQGVLGSDEHETTHFGRLLHRSRSRPMTIAVIADEAALQDVLPILEGMIPEGMLAFSEVEVVKYSHDARSTERRTKPRV
jgi:PII-like signaling protein